MRESTGMVWSFNEDVRNETEGTVHTAPTDGDEQEEKDKIWNGLTAFSTCLLQGGETLLEVKRLRLDRRDFRKWLNDPYA